MTPRRLLVAAAVLAAAGCARTLPAEPPRPAALAAAADTLPRADPATAQVLASPGVGRVELSGGAAAGITPGSVYRFGPALLRVVGVERERARAVVVPGGRSPEVGDTVVLEAFAFPESVLRVDLSGLPAPARGALRDRLPDPEVALATTAAGAHLRVRADGDRWTVAAPDGAVRHALAAADPDAAADRLAALLRREQALLFLATLRNPTEPFAVELAFADGDARFRAGEAMPLRVRTARDGYLTVVDVGPAGAVRVLFPATADAEASVRAGQEVRVPARGEAPVAVEGGPGPGVVRAFVTARPVELPFLRADAPRAPLLSDALLVAAGGPTGGGPVPVAGWSAAVLPYDVVP